MLARGKLTRPLAGLALVAAGLVALWAVGALSDPGSTETTDEAGRTVQLDPPDLSLMTDVPAGYEVGLRQGDVAPDFAFSGHCRARQKHFFCLLVSG